ncbi:hypothetical protein BJV78DRAFT_1150603 [Lactifluus subvellereus]|nr:hypothetical protein BJV78DRAFT_1150603 [Lactifluus subvellereus]
MAPELCASDVVGFTGLTDISEAMPNKRSPGKRASTDRKGKIVGQGGTATGGSHHENENVVREQLGSQKAASVGIAFQRNRPDDLLGVKGGIRHHPAEQDIASVSHSGGCLWEPGFVMFALCGQVKERTATTTWERKDSEGYPFELPVNNPGSSQPASQKKLLPQ